MQVAKNIQVYLTLFRHNTVYRVSFGRTLQDLTRRDIFTGMYNAQYDPLKITPVSKAVFFLL